MEHVVEHKTVNADANITIIAMVKMCARSVQRSVIHLVSMRYSLVVMEIKPIIEFAHAVVVIMKKIVYARSAVRALLQIIKITGAVVELLTGHANAIPVILFIRVPVTVVLTQTFITIIRRPTTGTATTTSATRAF